MQTRTETSGTADSRGVVVAADPCALNRRAYDAVAAQWDQARTALSAAEQGFLDALLQGLPPGSRVLDLGCGSGRPIAQAVLAAGHALTGVDQSQKLLQRARARLPQGDWVEATLQDYEPRPGFAAAIAWDSLFHLPRDAQLPLFRRVRRALAPGSGFMLTVGGSEHPAFTDTMFGETFFYDSHPPATAMALLAEAGFAIRMSSFLNLPTGGRDKGRYAILADAA